VKAMMMAADLYGHRDPLQADIGRDGVRRKPASAQAQIAAAEACDPPGFHFLD
jgi:hypothetical protein